MSAICLFGALCAVNQSVLNSNGGLDLFDPTISEVNSTEEINSNYSYMISPSETPCPSIFQYIQDSGEWYGEVTLENVDLQKDINLRLELIVEKNLVGKNYGAVDLTHDKESENNQTLVYKVTFPTQNPVPKVNGIYYNDQLICSGLEDADNSTINLINIVTPGQSNLQTKNLSNHDTQSQTIKYKREITKKKRLLLTNDGKCGVSMFESTQSYYDWRRGGFSWLVAYFHKNEFNCGGNLISKRLVITAAHCIQDKGKSSHQTKESFVYLGKSSLDYSDEPYSFKKGVERFIVHPDWKPFESRYDADIAIIVMESPVEYSKYIIPVCVWKYSDDLDSIVGQQGSLAGWGHDEFGVLSSQHPKIIKAKIIKDADCYRNFTALAQVSSDRTFCAAGGEYEAPCQGDSGGGLIFKKQNKWYLRGLVSASQRFENCVPGSPTIFTDVAKFKEFIQSSKTQNKSSMSDCGKRDPGWKKTPGDLSLTTRAEWPWLVAFYDQETFICGGSLISTTQVIVAAHCIQDKGKSTKRRTRDAAVYLGKHKLDEINEPGSIKKNIDRFIVHEDWKPFDISYDADIAIIVMDSPVTYNKYIRPICLGNDVYQQSGTLAGWGSNQNLVSHIQMFESILTTCSGRDNEHLFVKASSPRTFCGGHKYDGGPCRIDTGGGFVVYTEDKWYLKGLVAGSLTTNKNPCESNSYGVFTDVSKFNKWITSNVLN